MHLEGDLASRGQINFSNVTKDKYRTDSANSSLIIADTDQGYERKLS